MTAVSPRRPGKPPVEPNPGPPPPVPQPRRPAAPVGLRIADEVWWTAYERLCRESFDGTPLAGAVWLPSW